MTMKDTLYFALSNFANVKRSCHSYKLPPFERAVCCIRFYEGLARAISSYTHLPIVDALRGMERDSQYVAKKRGLTLSAEDMGFYRNIHFNGHPMKATSVVIPFPSMPIRCRLIPNIGLFILSLSILS